MFYFTARAVLIAFVASQGHATPVAPSVLATLGEHSVLEKVTIPSEWSHAGSPHPESVMNMQIGLKQSNMAGLQKKLLEVSHPDHASYGKWLSKDDMEQYTKPSQESVALVKT